MQPEEERKSEESKEEEKVGVVQVDSKDDDSPEVEYSRKINLRIKL